MHVALVAPQLRVPCVPLSIKFASDLQSARTNCPQAVTNRVLLPVLPLTMGVWDISAFTLKILWRVVATFSILRIITRVTCMFRNQPDGASYRDTHELSDRINKPEQQGDTLTSAPRQSLISETLGQGHASEFVDTQTVSSTRNSKDICTATQSDGGAPDMIDAAADQQSTIGIDPSAAIGNDKPEPDRRAASLGQSHHSATAVKTTEPENVIKPARSTTHDNPAENGVEREARLPELTPGLAVDDLGDRRCIRALQRRDDRATNMEEATPQAQAVAADARKRTEVPSKAIDAMSASQKVHDAVDGSSTYAGGNKQDGYVGIASSATLDETFGRAPPGFAWGDLY